MQQAHIRLVVKVLAIVGLVSSGMIAGNAGLVWGAFILTFTGTVLMLIRFFFVDPPSFPWNQKDGWIIFVSVFALSIFFLILGL